MATRWRSLRSVFRATESRSASQPETSLESSGASSTHQLVTRSLVIDSSGSISFLDEPQIRASIEQEGSIERRRASHVEPVSKVKRLTFHLLRGLVADDSPVAAWTRSWRGPWRINLGLSGGPTFGSFAGRAEAISAEEAWLLENRL